MPAQNNTYPSERNICLQLTQYCTYFKLKAKYTVLHATGHLYALKEPPGMITMESLNRMMDSVLLLVTNSQKFPSYN